MQGYGLWKTTKYSAADGAMRAFFSVLATLLCFYSAVWMARDIFPDWKLSGTAQLWICAAAVFTILLYEMGILALPCMRIICGLAVPVIYGYVCFRYVKQCQIDLEDGACAIATQFLEKFNRHLQTSFWIWQGKTEWIGLAFAFWTLVILTGLLVLALILGKRMILLLLPAAVFAAELLIGFVPQWEGMALFFAALLFVRADGGEDRPLLQEKRSEGRRAKLSVRRDRREKVPWYMCLLPPLCLAGAAALMLAGGSLLSGATAAELMKKAPEVLAFQRETEQNISEMLNGFVTRRNEMIGNRAPRYTGKEMLKVTAAKKPEEDVLLKGFYGTDYRNGSWFCESGKFEEACTRAGYSVEEAQKELMQAQYDIIWEYGNSYNYSYVVFGDYDFVSDLKDENNEYTVEYTGSRSRYAYLPYVTDYAEGQGREHLSGDVAVHKAWNQKEFTFSTWNHSIGLAVIDRMSGMARKNIFTWYNEFALDAYLEASDQVPWIGEYARQVSGNDFIYNPQLYMNGIYMDAAQVNRDRLNLALTVGAYLQYYQTYSMDLDPLPQGEDPVSFFLMQSRKGYCVHFASAAVQMLRQLGVPARYVSGYAARAEDFVQKGDVYVASVKDRDAHAWAEIYLDNLGWVPVDVTPGITERGDGQNAGNAEGGGSADTGNPDTQTDAEDDTQTGSDDTQTETDDTQTDAEENKDAEGQKDQKDQKKAAAWASGWLEKPAVRLLVLVTAVLLAGWMMRCAVCLYRMAPAGDIRAGNHTRAVMRVNGRLYRILRLKRKIQKEISDTEYEQLLKDNFPSVPAQDWTRFMQTARLAAFGKHQVSKEEAGFCCLVYRKSWNSNE